MLSDEDRSNNRIDWARTIDEWTSDWARTIDEMTPDGRNKSMWAYKTVVND